MSAEENGNLVPATNTQLEENAEFRGSKEDQEDLLLTAQRYLNIFHQIHIFKAFKRDQFNKELIEMPEKIRKIVAMLPGGRVLLEYIEEIEKDKGIQDAGLSALIEQQEKEGASADKDNSYTLRQSGVPAVINAPIEISSDFTNLLKDAFNSYSQNLQQLSANIQKIAAQKTVTTADGKVQVVPDITDTISSLLKENAKQQTEVLKSFGETLSKSLMETKSEMSNQGLTDTIVSLLKENAQQQNEVLKSLGATLAQTITDSKGEPASSGTSNTITALLRENAQQQNEVLKSLGETLSQTLSASKSQGSGSDITETISSLLKENAHQQNEVLKSLSTTLAQTMSASKAPSVNYDLTETVSSLLKESARQQTEVLKSFGETLSQTIMQSQKELVASLLRNQSPTLVQVQAQAYASPLPQYKNEAPVINQEVKTPLPEESTILPLPVNTVEEKPVEQAPEVVAEPTKVISQPVEAALPTTEVEPEPQAVTSEPQTEKAEDIIEPETAPEKGSIFKAMSEKLAETKNKLSQTLSKASEDTKSNKKKAEEKAPKEEIPPTVPVEEKAEVAEVKTQEQPTSGKSKKHKKKSAEQKARQETNDKNQQSNKEEIPDNFVFALPAEEKTDTEVAESKNDIPLADFDFDDAADNISATIFNDSSASSELATDDLPQLPTDNSADSNSDSIDIDLDDFFSAAESAQATDNSDNAETPQKTEQPVLLSADDDMDLGSAFATTKETAAENNLNEPQTYDNAMLKIRDALSNTDSVSLDDIASQPVSLSPADDTPSVEEDSLAQAFSNFADTAEVISSNEADNSDWQYTTDNTAKAATDDNEEWEYVDENGNPISPDDDTEWEYVDEDGNPISADGDEEWEYVDENGNPVSPDDDTEWEYVDEDGNPVSPDDDAEWEYTDENGNVVNH